MSGGTDERIEFYRGRGLLDSAALTTRFWHSPRGTPPGTSGCKMHGRRLGEP